MLNRLCAASLLLAALSAGCVAPNSLSGYLTDRRHDLIDGAHLDASLFGRGFVVHAGPAILGAHRKEGLLYSPTDAQLGLGGIRTLQLYRDGWAAGAIWPFERWSKRRPVFGPRPKRSPSPFALGFYGGYFVSIGAAADLCETLDFLLGLVCIDLVGDDEHVKPRGTDPIPQLEREHEPCPSTAPGH